MKDKIVLITGATSGIGKATAIGLAKLGAEIVFTARNKEKAEQTKNEILVQVPAAKISWLLCDLSSLQSIKNCAEEYKTKHTKLDVLINNAGIWITEELISKDGFEMTFAVNHLAPFLLTNLLLDTIKATPKSRIVNLSSGLHYQGKFNSNDLENKQSKFSGFQNYNNSKLYNALFTKQLSGLLKNSGVIVNCLHPGVVKTSLFDTAGGFARTILSLFMITPEKGAKTSIYLASSPEVEKITGEYFDKCKVKKAAPTVYDENAQQQLWDESITMVNKFL